MDIAAIRGGGLWALANPASQLGYMRLSEEASAIVNDQILVLGQPVRCNPSRRLRLPYSAITCDE
jgi:hypothetical protein